MDRSATGVANCSNSVVFETYLRSAHGRRHPPGPPARQPLPPRPRRAQGTRGRPAARPRRSWSRRPPRPGCEIVAVADTHVHNDYVSGAPLLARRHGADYLVAAEESVSSPHVGVRGGDVLAVGDAPGRGASTPPGTPTTTRRSWSATGHGPAALLSRRQPAARHRGPHRPGRARAHARARPRPVGHAPARSRRCRPSTLLLPTHGFGSFCAGSAPRRRRPTAPVTLGHQLVTNPALTTEPRELRRPAWSPATDRCPTYYAHMARPQPGRRRRAAARHPPRPATADQVTDAILVRASGSSTCATGSGSPRATSPARVSLEHSDQFATYVGWLVPWQDDIVLLADDPERPRRSGPRPGRRSASTGVATHVLADDQALPAHATAGPGGRTCGPSPGPPVLLDVRRRRRVRRGPPARGGHTSRSTSSTTRLLDLPAGEVWVYCRSGFRAGTAASLLQRGGRAVVHLDDEWDPGRRRSPCPSAATWPPDRARPSNPLQRGAAPHHGGARWHPAVPGDERRRDMTTTVVGLSADHTPSLTWSTLDHRTTLLADPARHV